MSVFTERAANPIRRLWRGEYSLPAVFWGLFVLGFFVLTSVLGRLLWPIFASVPYRWFVATIQLAFGITVGLGVWRSADTHRGHPFWAHAARVVVSLWLVVAVWYLATTAPIR